jgi:AcrR family transcriptional regulator
MTTKLTREERRSVRTTEIVDIAARLFADKGYEATGVSELCEAVGLGRGALYHYIESKENLLGLIHDRVADLMLPQGQRILDLDVPADKKLRDFGEATIAVILDYPDHVWVFMHERRTLTDEVGNRFRMQRRAYEDQLAAILTEGRDKGLFVFDDLRLTVLAWFGLHNYTYQWLRREGRLDRATIADAFFRIFVGGVGTDLERASL